MGLFRVLTEKPWTVPATDEVDDGRGASSVPTSMFGLRVFLAMVAVMFSLLTMAYIVRMGLGDWRPLPTPWLLWLNTALLILSSIALQWARIGARRLRIDDVELGLLAGGVFAFAFLVGQFLAWRHLGELGYFAATNPANAFFYMITALHALHLAGGLVAWGRTVARLRRGFAAEQLRVSVDLCTVYWHFLLLVWLALFGLLLFT